MPQTEARKAVREPGGTYDQTETTSTSFLGLVFRPVANQNVLHYYIVLFS